MDEKWKSAITGLSAGQNQRNHWGKQYWEVCSIRYHRLLPVFISGEYF
jgi:hypothetical protein